MTINYASQVAPSRTPQSVPLFGSDQVENSASGYSFAVDNWTQLDRFLILGTEGGSYYATERKLTLDNATVVLSAIKEDGLRVVARLAEISIGGRAPKNDPALFVLAMVTAYGTDTAKAAAYAVISLVARTGTHFLHLVDYIHQMRGFGRGLRTALGSWYTEQEPKKLLDQLFKYASRDGWSHADALQLIHPKPPTNDHNKLFALVSELYNRDRGYEAREIDILLGNISTDLRQQIAAIFALKQTQNVSEAAELISTFKLPRELVPTELLTNPDVWAALLPHMGVTATIRSLPTMTRVGLLQPLSDAERTVRQRLANGQILQKARVHPIHVLQALLTYQSGHSVRGKSIWTPLTSIVDALDEAFYQTFEYVEPTGKRIVLALDVSGSMNSGVVAGVEGLTPRVAAAALAMVTARTEENYVTVGFTAGINGSSRMYGRNSALTVLDISPKLRLDEVVRRTNGLSFGGTDCALPMLWAREQNIMADAFTVYTDSETWAGVVHPTVALNDYRNHSGIAAKEVVVGMVSNGFTIADPTDAGQLDVVGFDTATPALIADFIRSGF